VKRFLRRIVTGFFAASCDAMTRINPPRQPRDSIEDAKDNLKEAIDLFLEYAPVEEKSRRIHSEMFITTVSA
jgi:predicted RNase H-like HicB family nuclease